MSLSFVGIDPGVNGGIVILQGDRVTTFDIPESDSTLFDMLDQLEKWEITFGALEKVTGYIPHTGKKWNGQPGSHMFELGISYGRCRMGMTYLLDDDWVLPAPITWQKGLGLKIPSGLTYEQRKRELHSHARRLIPDTKISRQCADAALIALYAQKLYHSIRTTESTNANRTRS